MLHAHAFFVVIVAFHLTSVTSFKLSRPISPQPAWGLLNKRERVNLADLVNVVGRFRQRCDFYEGTGYRRPESGLLTSESFFETIGKLPFKTANWPRDVDGKLLGTEGMEPAAIKATEKNFKASPPSQEACDIVFTALAKGATNGQAYPAQADEEMLKWLSPDRTLDLRQLERELLWGRFNVFLGWFLYIGLQFGGVYVVFFVPIMQVWFAALTLNPKTKPKPKPKYQP